MQCLALCLTQLGTECKVILFPLIPKQQTILQFRHLICVVLVRNKCLQAGFYVFIEAFEQGQCQRVFDMLVLNLIVNRVVAIYQTLFIIGVLVIICWRAIGLIDVVVIADIECVDETGYRYVFAFHRGIDRILNSLQSIQTIDGSLTVNFYAGGVGSYIERVSLWLFAYHLGSFGATGWLLGIFFFAQLFLVGILLLLFCLVLLHRFLGKLAGLDFFVGHLNHAIETNVVTMTQEQVLVVVTVPVL